MNVIPASPGLATDHRAKLLIEHLRGVDSELPMEGTLVYYNFPLYRDEEGVLYRSSILVISRSHGLQVFNIADLVQGTASPADITRVDEDSAQLSSLIQSKLIRNKGLRQSAGKLRFPIQHFVFTPDLPSDDLTAATESRFITSLTALSSEIDEARLPVPLTVETFNELRSALEGAKGMMRPKERDITNLSSTSMAAILKRLESEIANFDTAQRQAAISIVNGPQRIRGLAGSGKTVVLAWKAAQIHLSNPDADILFTFYTKSLYDFIRRLITRFYRQYNDVDPDWSKIHVLHGWGGRTTGPGVYYNASVSAGVPPLNFKSPGVRNAADPYDYAVSELLKTNKVTQRYDYVLIDEAQDFSPAFFKLCFQLCRGGKHDRNIVWGYDELQSILNVTMKGTTELFGTDEDGQPLVDLEREGSERQLGFSHDIVLHKCYRNPLEVLLTSHAIGFGIYSDTPVQMLENPEHWEDVGYVVEKGGHPGEDTTVYRPPENSPLSISEAHATSRLITTHTATSLADEVEWVVKGIRTCISEGLRPEDILIILLDDRNAKDYSAALSEALAAQGIATNSMQADPFGQPTFTLEGHVTLSTVYRAKGNEAPVVFAVGIDALFLSRKLLRGRNKLFTAFTRAKGWLRVSGIGDGAQYFFREIDVALKNSPRMRFVYPDPSAIAMLQRDLSDKSSKLRKMQERMEEQLEAFDLDDEERAHFVETMLRPKA